MSDRDQQLGELLVRESVVSLQRLEEARVAQKRHGGRLTVHLANLGLVSEEQLTAFLATKYGVATISLHEFEIDPGIISLIPMELAKKYRAVPVSLAGRVLVVAMSDPLDMHAIDALRFRVGHPVEAVLATDSMIDEALARYYGDHSHLEDAAARAASEISVVEASNDASVVDLERRAEEAPIIELCNTILRSAIKRGASDVHIEAYEKSFRVRYRVDGVLYEEEKPIQLALKDAIVSRFKIMAKINIAERRLPQDGRFKLRLGPDREMDFRVSIAPMLFGEKVVLRLLDKSNLQLDMRKLGFEEHQLRAFQAAIHQPFGMVLVTGPTGSGKTTTLYSALAELNKITENISTAEDPVEYNLAGINQMQINDDIGLKFSVALRTFLRQDPDIIMVGEIRDYETAEIAIKAALTGHLVLSTLHTNDAPSTVSRLLDMGVQTFMVAASVNMIVAQRLARLICKDCRKSVGMNPKALTDLGMDPAAANILELFKGTGCPRCSGTGYKGRVALYEVMTLSDALKKKILESASAAELKQTAIAEKMQTLRVSGLKQLLAGTTTIEEVARVTAAD